MDITNTLSTSKDDNATLWSELDASFLNDLVEDHFDPDNQNTSKLRDDNQYKGFDNNSGGQYIYPINFPIRSYQFNIIKSSLFQNTLIVLPTGLGKTFIAAVVMYNIYRWYPTGKVIFMAPTRPLVSQQIEACRKIMGIPVEHTAEMTGKQNKKLRTEYWQNKRVFFATPQVVQIDINDPELNFPFDKIKLVVVDEAHKAKGRYAYTDVIQTIINRNPYFRVLALSATPGRRIEDVIEIVQNLYISKLEIRAENSIDVMPYTHKKNIKIIEVPLGERLTQIRDELICIIDPYIRNLIDNQVLSNSSAGMFTKNWLILEQRKFKETSVNQRHPKHSAVSTDFSISISLYHALELLERHGLRVFLNFFDDSNQEDNNKQEKFFVQTNSKLRNFLNSLRQEIGPNPFAVSDQTMTNGKIHGIPDNLDFGHPKFDLLKQSIVDHFTQNKDSKVIIFCEFRESVMLLHRLLLQSRPLVLPRMFVGQGGTGSIRAVSQKEQIQVMNDFRNGISNTIIATSVAEEGIDVGEVDLIICFDISSKNPTRFVQRIGRTGRKRQGKVIMLATEGKEHSLVKEVLATKDKVNQKLNKSRSIQNILYQRSPRIVPPEFNPKCLEVFMKEEPTITLKTKNNTKSTNNNDNNKKNGGRRKKIENPPAAVASQDVRNFFKKIVLDKEDRDVFAINTPSSTTNLNNIIPDNDLICVDNIMNEYGPVSQIERPVSSQSSSIASNNTVTSNLDINLRKMTRFARHLDKDKKFPNYSNISETIKSKTIDADVKKFILKNNQKFVRDNYEAMQVICVLENDKNKNDYKIDSTEKIIKSTYLNIENVFNSKYAVESFLNEEAEAEIDDDLQENFDLKFSSFFDEFDERDIADSAEQFVNEKLNEIDMKLLEPEEENENVCKKNKTNKSTFYEDLLKSETDTYLELDLDFGEFASESKYASQWTQFDNNKIKNQSTPISSKKLHKTNDISIPLAFQNEIKKQNTIIDKSKKSAATCLSFGKPEIKSNSFDKNVIQSSLLKPEEKLYSTSVKNNQTVQTSLKKNYEISADLFDDDFEDLLASNDILKSIDNKCSHTDKNLVNLKEHNEVNIALEKINSTLVENHIKPSDHNFIKPKLFADCLEDFKQKNEPEELKPSSTKSNSSNESMITVEEILEIVAKKELELNQNKGNVSNPELEDFDLNEFLEPFEEEEEIFNKSPLILECDQKENPPEIRKVDENSYSPAPGLKISQKENSPPILEVSKSKIINNNSATTISRQTSDDLFDVSSLKNAERKNSQNLEINEKCVDISPSLIGRRISQIKSLKFTPRKLNLTTKSSPLSTPNCHTRTSFDIHNTSNDESVLIRPNRLGNNIISSSSDSETSDSNIVEASQEVKITPARSRFAERWNERQKNRRRKRRCHFIDDEAAHSGTDSGGNDETLDTGKLDSIVVSDDEEDDPNVNMQAKYLQSIRSPNNVARGAFRIPAPRQFMDFSKIFSQTVKPDDTSYRDCSSFVVSDDENIVDGEISTICPLEQAEAILKARRKSKRKRNELNKNNNNCNIFKRRRILNNIVEVSDDDENN